MPIRRVAKVAKFLPKRAGMALNVGLKINKFLANKTMDIAKVSKKSKWRKAASLGMAAAAGAVIAGGAAKIYSDFKKRKKDKSEKSGKRRRGKVPKTVKKWASRFISRRKQEEKIVKGIFGTDGGKVIKKAKKASSSGVITQQEALAALRR